MQTVLPAGHRDSINLLSPHRKLLTTAYSGSFDGVVKEWNLSTRKEQFSITAHQGKISGLTTITNRLLTCGDDSLIKFWDNDPLRESSTTSEPIHQLTSKKNRHTGRNEEQAQHCGEDAVTAPAADEPGCTSFGIVESSTSTWFSYDDDVKRDEKKKK